MANQEIRIPEWAAGMAVEAFTPNSLKLRYTGQLPVFITLNTNTKNSSVHIHAEYKSGVADEVVTFTTSIDLGWYDIALLHAFLGRLAACLKECSPRKWQNPPPPARVTSDEFGADPLYDPRVERSVKSDEP